MIANKFLDNIIWRGTFLFTQFVINLILARLLGASGSGVFNLLINNLAFIILLTGLSLEASITFLASSHSQLRGALAFLSLLWPLVAGTIAALAFNWYAGESRDPFLPVHGALLAGGYVAAMMWQSFFSGLFYAEQNFKTVNAVLAISNCGYVVFLLFLLQGAGSSEGRLAIQLFFGLATLQGLLIAILYFRQASVPKIAVPQWSQLKRIGRYGALVLLNNLVFFLLYRVDYWLLNYYRSDAELGNYIQVSKLGQIFMLLPGILAAVIFPVAARGNAPQLARRLPLLGRLVFSLYLAILILLGITGQWLFPFLYGQGFSGMYIPFLWLAPGILALTLHALLTAYFAGKDRVRVNLLGSSCALLVVLLVDFYLVPKWGNAGAALGSSLAYITYAIIMFVYFYREEQISYKTFLIIRKSDWTELKNIVLARSK